MVKTIGNKNFFIHEKHIGWYPTKTLCQTNYLNHIYFQYNQGVPPPPYDKGIVAVFKLRETF